VPLIKVPRCHSSSQDDEQSTPLNLTVPRDTAVRESESISSSYRVLCEWDASDNSTPGTDAARTSTSEPSPSQILLLSGKQYEIVPLGDGRWISRNEYELQQGLQKSSSSGAEPAGVIQSASDGRSGLENNGSVDGALPVPSTSAGGGGMRRDDEVAKEVVVPDEVSSTIVTESETASDICKEEDDDGQLHIVEGVTSEHDDDDDDDGDVKIEQEQEHSENNNHSDHTDTTSTTTTPPTTTSATTTTPTTTTVAVESVEKCVDAVIPPCHLPVGELSQ